MATPYTQLQSEPPSAPLLEESGLDKAAMFNQQQQQHQQQQQQHQQGDVFKPLYPSPPPAYSEQPPKPVPMQPYPPQSYPAQPYPAQPYPAQPNPGPMQHYPQPGAIPSTVVMMQPPPQQVVPTPVQPSVVVIGGAAALPPGACSLCRVGMIKSSPSCCTYCCCLFLLPLGILPGIIAYFCCCQKPKCTNCGYSP